MKVLSFIFLLTCSIPAAGQPFPSLAFSHITEKNGLSNNNTQGIIQDDRGFIWIGTHDGLNRLDGYRVKTFYHTPNDSNSLVNNSITQMLKGSGNTIWISTIEGISCYAPGFSKFTNFRHVANDAHSLSADYARAMYFDSSRKEMWISVPNSTYCFNESLHYAAYPVEGWGLPAALPKGVTHYYGMYEDSRGQRWIYVWNWIFKIDKGGQKIIASYHTPSVDIRTFLEDSDHRFWVGTFGGGLLRFDPENNIFTPIQLEGNTKYIHALCEWKDKNGHPWIVAGATGRMLLIDPKTTQNKMYNADPLNEFSLSQGDINCLFVDRENILWIATGNGVSYIAPSRQKIEAWDIASREERVKDGLNDFIYGFSEDSSWYLASCWGSERLLRFDKQGGFTREPMPDAAKKICGILKTGNGFLISAENGLMEYHPDKHFTTFIPVGEVGLRTILQYDDSTYFIRTRNNGNAGIYVYNSRQKKMTARYYGFPGCHDCLPPKLQDILITRNKEILTSPQDHYLYRLDKKKDRFVPFFSSDSETTAFPSKTFSCLAEDAAGHLWVGTSNGLFELDLASKKMIRDLSSDRKLAGIAIEALCFDDDNNLWMNTARGLFCITGKANRIYNFNTEDGLPNNSLPGFLYRGIDGYMYAGGLGYILKFRPSEILRQEMSGDVEISEVMVMNTPMPAGNKDGRIKKVVLEPGQNIFSVDYCMLNYDNAPGGSYYYRLDRIMKEWKENADGHLSFYNLPPGGYVLHVRGGDKYGSFSRNESILTVIVKPYWWQTRWFYIAMVLAVGLLVYLFVRRRIQAIREQSGIRIKMAETEMMALRAQMNPHFVFNSLNIVDGLISGNRKDEAKDFLQKFSKLIRLTLENSQQQLVPLESDLKTLKLYTELECIRYDHSFTYSFEVDEELLHETVRIPPLLLQPYVENAIIHGLRNKEDGQGVLFVCIQRVDDQLAVIIEDNGVGMARAAEISAVNNKLQKHLGMEVTGKRIDLLKTISSNKISVTVLDICEPGRTGTVIRLLLPLAYHFDHH